MKKFISILLLVLTGFAAYGADGNVVIIGKSNGLAGKKISANLVEDYITLKPAKIAESVIEENGDFKINFSLAEIREVILKVDGLNSFLYAQPGATYNVRLADLQKGQNKSYANNQVELLFDTLPKHDINNLVLDFDERLDAFMAYNLKKIGSLAFQKEIDTFKVYLSKVYKDIDEKYFRDYVYYSIAEIEQIGGINVDMVKLKAKLYRDYLSQGKILYHHQKFMIFFGEYYTDVFKLTSNEDDKILISAINYKKSPKMIDELLAKDGLLRNERIRELVMIKALGEEYHSGNYYQDHIISILDSVRISSKFPEHQLIAGNLIGKLTQLGVAYPAPDFSLTNDKGDVFGLKDFKGKYIYLHFWASWNTSAISEMKIMTELQKKYGQDIAFVSINMDDSRQTWLDFLKQHPEMKWTHLHYSYQPEIIDAYRISSLSIFYLIGPDGKMIQSPAYRPTPNGTFVSIDQTFYDIHRRLHPREKTKTGSK